MPALDNGYVAGSGELTSTSATFVDALCSSPALDDGVVYFAFGQANYRNEGGNSWGSEIEGRFGTTRLGRGGWRSIFGQFNLGDDVGGGSAVFLGVVTGNGSSTLNMRAASTSGGDGILVGGQSWLWFEVPGTQGSDHAYAEMTSDAVSVTPNGATWSEGDAGGQVTITPSSSGTWLILAVCEALPENGAANTNEIRARLRQRTDPLGTPVDATIGSGEQFSEIQGTNPQHFAPTLFEMDVVTLTGGTTYRFLWEFQNASGNAAIGYRRERVYAFRLGVFRHSAFITNAGGIVDLVGAETEAANGLTFDFSPDTGDVAILGNAPSQNDGAWAGMWLRRDGTPDVDIPSGGNAGGRMHAAVDTNFPAGDVVNVPQSYGVAATGSMTFRLVAQAEAAPGCTYGRNRGDSDDARSVLVALDLFATTDQFELGGTVTADMQATIGGGAAATLFSDGVTADMEATIAGDVGFGLGGTVESAAEASIAGEVGFGLGGTVTADMAATISGGAAFELEGTAAASMEAAVSGAVAFSFAGTVTAGAEATIEGSVGSDVSAIIGSEGEPLLLEVANVDGSGFLRVHAETTRPVRFNLVSAAGETVSPGVVDTITAKLRRASDPVSATIEVVPQQDETEVGETTYGWSLDLSAIDRAGVWVLELDVVLTGGLAATWPSAGPLRIRAVEGVD